jgi:hypothetical protein
MIDYLRENYEVPAKAATLAARLSEGVLGKALELLGDGEDANRQSFRSYGLRLFKAALTESGAAFAALAEELLNLRDRGRLTALLGLWQSLARDCQYLAVTGDAAGLTNVDLVQGVKELSGQFASARRTAALVGAIENTLADSRRNVHIPLALAALAFRMRAAIEAPVGPGTFTAGTN